MAQQIKDSPLHEANEANDLLDPVFLKTLREMMLKFAVLQLADQHLAEDAVQEALIGALKNADSFGRRAAYKTWVFSILKNKIADIHRQRQRLDGTSRLLDESDDQGQQQNMFDNKGFWATESRPARWAQPLESVKNDQFWRVFDSCLNGLPANQARLFMMREFVELSGDEICATLGITTSNLHVILYRARLQLRKCLEHKWFLKGERS